MITETLPAPGIYRDIPFAEYLSWPLMSQSVLKHGRESMLALRWELDHIGDDAPTDDMNLGAALHTGFLEPGELHNRVVCWEGSARRGKEWEAFKAENASKVILTAGYYRNLTNMVSALWKHPEIKRWRDRIEAVEVSCIGNLHGEPFKGRVDGLTDDPLWDLKKISSTDDRTITSTIWDYGYHIQGYIYTTLFNRSRFCLGFIEGSPPYDVRPIELSEAWLSLGRKETTSLIQRMQFCKKTGKWPGRSEELEIMEPPDYALQQFGSADEITIGTESAF